MNNIMDKYNEMKQVRDDVVNCHQCNLCKTRIKPVIGKGNHDAKVLFIGEAPGESEDKTGLPFVGQAGQVLDGLIAKAGLGNNEVYICNVVKCRPPENRDPSNQEKLACLSFLTRQISIVQPEVIVCLGKHSAETIFQIFGIDEKITSMAALRGKVFEPGKLFKQTSLSVGDIAMAGIKIIVMYHPAALLYNKSLKAIAEKDFKSLKKQ